MTAGPQPRALWFGPEGERAFGMLHVPAGEARRFARAVVVCPPLGAEAVSAHRTLRRIAEDLCRNDVPVLRLDYAGTGDADGWESEPGRPTAWQRSVAAAVATVRQETGAGEVTLVGLRYGASLAVLHSAEAADVTSAVLWAPCTSGRAYARELHAMAMLQASKSVTRHAHAAGGSGAPDPHGSGSAGGEEIGGFTFSADTVAALRTVDLTALPATGLRRALVVDRDDRKPDTALAQHLAHLGVTVEERRLAGYAPMMVDDPSQGELPAAVVDAIVTWVVDDARHATPAVPAAPGAPAPVVVEVVDSLRAPTPLPRWAAKEEGPNAAVVETEELPVRMGADGRLFGIVTRPVASPASPAPVRPGVLLLNTGAIHRIGPGRLHVALARSWAAAGFTVLRVDLGGIGDSAPPTGATENEPYAAFAIDDAEIAGAFLDEFVGRTRRAGPAGHVSIGICSGAYIAFQTALGTRSPSAVVLVNQLVHERRTPGHDGESEALAFKAAQDLRVALLRPRRWLAALRGEVHLGRAARRLAQYAVLRVRERLGRGRKASESPVAVALRRIQGCGVEQVHVFGAGEAGLQTLRLHAGGALDALARQPGFSLVEIDGADHVFSHAAAQDDLYELLTARLLGGLGSSPGGPGRRSEPDRVPV